MSYPIAPALFADCLFNTSLLPSSITDGNGTSYGKLVSLPSSINGLQYNSPDPEDQSTLTKNINAFLSYNCYGSFNGGFFCSNINYVTGSTVTPSLNTTAGAPPGGVPCRYVVMHAGNWGQDAHQLMVNGAGVGIYTNTTWTS